jgi:hypothetical protein
MASRGIHIGSHHAEFCAGPSRPPLLTHPSQSTQQRTKNSWEHQRGREVSGGRAGGRCIRRTHTHRSPPPHTEPWPYTRVTTVMPGWSCSGMAVPGPIKNTATVTSLSSCTGRYRVRGPRRRGGAPAAGTASPAGVTASSEVSNAARASGAGPRPATGLQKQARAARNAAVTAAVMGGRADCSRRAMLEVPATLGVSPG